MIGIQDSRMINREVLDAARAAFSETPISPETHRDKIMFEAGARKVLDWIDTKIKKETSVRSVTAPDEVTRPDSQETLLRQLARKVK